MTHVRTAQQLSPALHEGFGWRRAKDFSFARRVGLIGVAPVELSRASGSMPVAILRKNGKWAFAAVLGPAADLNVFVARDGSWSGDYVPARLRTFPFLLCPDGSLSLWSGFEEEPVTREGVIPFLVEGGLSQELVATRRFLTSLQAGEEGLQSAMEALQGAGALTVWSPPGAERLNVNGRFPTLLRVRSDRLRELPDETVMTLFRSGVLEAVHLHMGSLRSADRILRMGRDLVRERASDVTRNQRGDAALDALSQDAGDIHIGDAKNEKV